MRVYKCLIQKNASLSVTPLLLPWHHQEGIMVLAKTCAHVSGMKGLGLLHMHGKSMCRCCMWQMLLSIQRRFESM